MADLDKRSLGQAQTNVEHAGSGNDVCQGPRLVDVEDVSRVVPIEKSTLTHSSIQAAKKSSSRKDSQERLDQHMQPQQIDQPLIRRRNRLRQRRTQRKPGEHLHKVIMRRVQPQRQALKPSNLLPRLFVIPTLLSARSHTRGRTGARESVRDGHVEGAEGGDLAGLGDAGAAAGGAEPGYRVGDAVDGFFEEAVGGCDPGG